jgi:hypothetical protein
MRGHPNFIHKIPSTKIHNKIICFMLVIFYFSYVGLNASWLFNVIAYLMSLQFWGEGKLHVKRQHVIGDITFVVHKFCD